MPTSWMPELVKTVTWLWSLATTLMSISCDELVDVVVALVQQRGGGGVGAGRCSAELRVDVGDLRHRRRWPVLTESAMPSSALAAQAWMPCVMPLSCCVSDLRRVDSTPLRADGESGLVDSACSAVVKLLNTVSSVPCRAGLAVDALQRL